jgi:hypothetical protein
LRGFVHSLSPTDGKFRVKGSVDLGLLAALFLDRNTAQRNEAGDFRHLRHVPAGISLFSLGRMAAITENARIKAPFFRQNRAVRFGGLQGRRPNDDPV